MYPSKRSFERRGGETSLKKKREDGKENGSLLSGKRHQGVHVERRGKWSEGLLESNGSFGKALERLGFGENNLPQRSLTEKKDVVSLTSGDSDNRDMYYLWGRRLLKIPHLGPRQL